jgi:hypothetical protein
VLQLTGAAIPIPAVVVITFNLMQDGVNPGSSRVRILLLHYFMGGIPFTRHGKVDCLQEILVHN